MDMVREKWKGFFSRPESREELIIPDQGHDITSVDCDVLEQSEAQSRERTSHGVENWERLVRALLKRDQLRITNIDEFLQTSDEIQSEDLRVSMILCEEAYAMAQALEPIGKGIGVLLFKIGMKTVIKQYLYKRNGARIDQVHNFNHLYEFYKRYKRQHRVDDLLRDEQKLRDSGSCYVNLRALEHRYSEMKTAIANLRVLVEAIEAHSDAEDPDGIITSIAEETRLIRHWNTMDKAYDNWERLVRATLKRVQLRNAGEGEERTLSGISGAVLPSPRTAMKIEAILSAVDEFQ